MPLPFARRAVLTIACLCMFSFAPFASAQAVLSEFGEAEIEYERAEAAYLELLGGYLPGAYRDHFAGLSDKQLQQIAETRKLWEFWTLGGSAQFEFQREFLDPIDKVGEMLIPEADSIRDKAVKEARARAGRLAEKFDRAKRRAGAEIDPTVGVVSPTGIAFPALDRPHTTVDRLLLMERSAILAHTVGPRESEAVLMKNAEFCTQIDFEEASFTMYANKVRMLTGANAWVANPVTTACARDHSIDRKAGRASGHTSTVPGKEGLGARAKRFGTPVRSEGAGGGKSGWHYIRGLSYGGGHTGPLYRSMRNVVGPGRVDGVYTSMYYYDKTYRHDCQEYRKELFMPPGVTKSDLQTDALISAYSALQQDSFTAAHNALKDAEKPEDNFQLAIHRYLLARVEAEANWWLNGVEHIAAAGDVYGAQQRLAKAKQLLSGIPSFDTAVSKIEKWMGKSSVVAEIEAGRYYYQTSAKNFTKAGMQSVIEKYPTSVYATAAKHAIENNAFDENNGYAPLMYFRKERDEHINKWAYLVDIKGS